VALPLTSDVEHFEVEPLELELGLYYSSGFDAGPEDVFVCGDITRRKNSEKMDLTWGYGSKSGNRLLTLKSEELDEKVPEKLALLPRKLHQE
jgi:hypothetical protein